MQQNSEYFSVGVSKSLLMRAARSPYFHYGLTAAILVLDFMTGPFVQFPIMFVNPCRSRGLVFEYMVGDLPLHHLASWPHVFRLLLANEPHVFLQWDMQILNFFIRVAVLCSWPI